MTFSGTTADINAALESLVFSPNLDFNGPTTLTYHDQRPGQHRLGGTTHTDVIDSPFQSVNGPAPTPSGRQVVDATTWSSPAATETRSQLPITDAPLIKVTLTVTHGRTLSTVPSIRAMVLAMRTMTFTGTQADANVRLAGPSSPAHEFTGPRSHLMVSSCSLCGW